ncbi:hypothetical protein QBC41DRAFT_103177 [Cercophora samala]|uniref:Uncharacterized protein n=1 Tax=Cercophora samala TaxID=330535 RepID=A0AA40DHJ4_9PEZI|nr:hypothetical protein QBC41DRAFT_103177 [Cercophora samala]
MHWQPPFLKKLVEEANRLPLIWGNKQAHLTVVEADLEFYAIAVKDYLRLTHGLHLSPSEIPKPPNQEASGNPLKRTYIFPPTWFKTEERKAHRVTNSDFLTHEGHPVKFDKLIPSNTTASDYDFSYLYEDWNIFYLSPDMQKRWNKHEFALECLGEVTAAPGTKMMGTKKDTRQQKPDDEASTVNIKFRFHWLRPQQKNSSDKFDLNDKGSLPMSLELHEGIASEEGFEVLPKDTDQHHDEDEYGMVPRASELGHGNTDQHHDDDDEEEYDVVPPPYQTGDIFSLSVLKAHAPAVMQAFHFQWMARQTGYMSGLTDMSWASSLGSDSSGGKKKD